MLSPLRSCRNWSSWWHGKPPFTWIGIGSRNPKEMDKKMRHTHRMERYSAIKWNEILTYITIWMNHKHILSEILYLYEVLRRGKFTETENRINIIRDWEESGEGVIFNWYRVSAWGDEKVLEMNSGDGYKTMWMYLMPMKCTFKNG